MIRVEKVAVLGTGLMGSALTLALVADGHQVTLWNRTLAKAIALEGPGVTAMADPGEAVSRSQLLVVCLAGYEVATKVLAEIGDLRDKIVVNVSTGTPQEVVEVEKLVVSLGGRYLDVALLARPDDVGTPHGHILVSGNRSAWEEARSTLGSFGGRLRFLSQQVTAAAVLELGALATFGIPSAVALAESASFIFEHDVDPQGFLEIIESAASMLHGLATEFVASIAAGDLSSIEASVDVNLAAAEEAMVVLGAAGKPTTMLAASVEVMRATAAAGRGGLGMAAMIDLEATPGNVALGHPVPTR